MGEEKPDRRQFLRLASVSALSREVSTASPEVQSQASPRKPNILIIMSDQHHAAVTKGSGFPLDVMPTLDGLAERGVRMERAYTPAPLCVPARISMLTGRWLTRTVCGKTARRPMRSLKRISSV